MLDPRIHPYRKTIAASFLRGKVKAPHFTKGTKATVKLTRTGLYEKPQGMMASELLHGEQVTVYEEKRGWSWIQATRDGYVGFVRTKTLNKTPVAKPTHTVVARCTFIYEAPHVKAKTGMMLDAATNIHIKGEAVDGFYAAEDGFVPKVDVAPYHAIGEMSFVDATLLYINTPYVWGGRSSRGIDCSGLIQNALQLAGYAKLPRDADMQEKALGVAIEPKTSQWQEGDLVFWAGHVGVVLHGERLLHANAHHMRVAHEPLAPALKRVAQVVGEVRSVRRLEAEKRHEAGVGYRGGSVLA